MTVKGTKSEERLQGKSSTKGGLFVEFLNTVNAQIPLHDSNSRCQAKLYAPIIGLEYYIHNSSPLDTRALGQSHGI